jgi:hypothetical protein
LPRRGVGEGEFNDEFGIDMNLGLRIRARAAESEKLTAALLGLEIYSGANFL